MARASCCSGGLPYLPRASGSAYAVRRRLSYAAGVRGCNGAAAASAVAEEGQKPRRTATAPTWPWRTARPSAVSVSSLTALRCWGPTRNETQSHAPSLPPFTAAIGHAPRRREHLTPKASAMGPTPQASPDLAAGTEIILRSRRCSVLTICPRRSRRTRGAFNFSSH